MLARLVATKRKRPIEEVEQTLACYDEIVLSLLDTGARVRALTGYFEVIKTKATRRKSPLLGGKFVKIPAKKKIVFRVSRKK
jgi:nucleoid DNA-binding protein